MENGVVNLPVEVEKAQCVFKNCPTDNLTNEMLRNDFIVVNCSIAKLATESKKKDFIIIDRSRTHLTAKFFESTIMTQINDLAERIIRKKNSFIVGRYIKNKLTANMMKQSFIV